MILSVLACFTGSFCCIWASIFPAGFYRRASRATSKTRKLVDSLAKIFVELLVIWIPSISVALFGMDFITKTNFLRQNRYYSDAKNLTLLFEGILDNLEPLTKKRRPNVLNKCLKRRSPLFTCRMVAPRTCPSSLQASMEWWIFTSSLQDLISHSAAAIKAAVVEPRPMWNYGFSSLHATKPYILASRHCGPCIVSDVFSHEEIHNLLDET